jgi:hypothetical protein
VLEHLKEPADLLRRIRPFLAEEGAVLASIPNVAHGSVRLALLAGEFRYRRTGLLDDTHLRFFTRAGIHDLFEGSGYMIADLLRHRVDFDRTEVRYPAPPTDGLQEWLAKDPDASVYQFVVRAVASDAANQLAVLRAELAAASERLLEFENARKGAELAGELQETVGQQERFIAALRQRVEALADQERETYESLLDAQRQLLLREQEVSNNEKEIERLQEEIERLQELLTEVEGELEALRATKVWRLAGKWWRIRNAVFRRR